MISLSMKIAFNDGLITDRDSVILLSNNVGAASTSGSVFRCIADRLAESRKSPRKEGLLD